MVNDSPRVSLILCAPDAADYDLWDGFGVFVILVIFIILVALLSRPEKFPFCSLVLLSLDGRFWAGRRHGAGRQISGHWAPAARIDKEGSVGKSLHL